MKKLLLLFALMGGLAACSDSSEERVLIEPTPKPNEKITFTGLLEATPDEGSRFEAFSEEGITMELELTQEGLYNLLMPEIKFVKQMPWLSIEVRGLQNIAWDNDIRFEVIETIPYFMGAPYDAYPIRNLHGEYKAQTKSFVVEFDCNTMHVSFTSSAAQ